MTLANLAPRNASSENVARQVNGYVYAVLFSDGWVKVGRGRDAYARINTHKSISRMRGAEIVDFKVSGMLVDSKDAEKKLLALCESYGSSVHGNEWFAGVDFERLCCVIDSEFSGDSEEQFEEYRAAFDGRMSVFDKVLASSSRALSDLLGRRHLAWDLACSHASIIEQIYLDDWFGGPIFEKKEPGGSYFHLIASISMYEATNEMMADIYSKAVNYPTELLFEFEEMAKVAGNRILAGGQNES